MADTIRSRAALLALFADNTAGDISAQDVRDFTVSAYEPQMIIPGGRLTLSSGVPVTTTDVTGATNVYYTPYLHNGIGLYDGTSWTLFAFSEITFALGTLSNNTNYDLFLYDNSGTLTLEATAWTNDTTRATALTLQDGVYVKSGATTRRYLGTFRTTSTTTTEDSAAKRFLWNAYNRAGRPVRQIDTTDSWSYASATWRQWRATSTNQIAIVSGLSGVSLLSMLLAGSSNNAAMRVGIGQDSASSPTDLTNMVTGATGGTSGMVTTLDLQPAEGYHYYAMLEACDGGTSITFYGDAGQTKFQTGLTGWYEC